MQKTRKIINNIFSRDIIDIANFFALFFIAISFIVAQCVKYAQNKIIAIIIYVVLVGIAFTFAKVGKHKSQNPYASR